MSELVAVRVPDELVSLMDARGKRSTVIIEALRAYLQTETTERPKATRAPEIAPKIETPREVGKLAPCPRCDGPTLEWGTDQRRCPKCSQNLPR